MPRLTPLTIPNGIWIHSAVLSQYTLQTDRLADRLTDGVGERFAPVPLMLTILIEIDVVKTESSWWNDLLV